MGAITWKTAAFIFVLSASNQCDAQAGKPGRVGA